MATISTLLISAAVIVLAAAAYPAAASEVRCPEWHDGARLRTVSVFDGPPSEHADLVPDGVHKTKDGTRSVWDVSYIFKDGRQLFVECRYGATASTVVLDPGRRRINAIT